MSTIDEIFQILFPILIIVLIIVIFIFLRHRRKTQIRGLRQRGLQRFFTCAGKERWGYYKQVEKWRDGEVFFLKSKIKPINTEISELRYDIEKIEDSNIKLNTLLTDQVIALNSAKQSFESDFAGMLKGKASSTENKIQNNLRQIKIKKDQIRVLYKREKRVRDCLKAYKVKKNPKLPLLLKLKSYFLYLK